jgi:hypothetical protein
MKTTAATSLSNLRSVPLPGLGSPTKSAWNTTSSRHSNSLKMPAESSLSRGIPAMSSEDSGSDD